ncbi:MAG: carbohydrate-binding family 9-like protein [Phycisphaerae bacterium]|nr:carbohydrate-binding family 9-like protein [Phycisphaerae bacterium]
MEYTISKKDAPPGVNDGWAEGYWSNVKSLPVDQFHPRSSDHRPVTEAKVAYSDDALHLIFRVQDRYVRCVGTKPNDPVCLDSCVEFFVQPLPGKGYFNFEINCGGTMLLYYAEDPAHTDSGQAKSTEVDAALAGQVDIRPSMPPVVDPEITEPVEWTIAYSIPRCLFERYVGPLGSLGGQTWRANFYKCGDKTSHPHWACWSPIEEELNFHQPKYFAPITFESR